MNEKWFLFAILNPLSSYFAAESPLTLIAYVWQYFVLDRFWVMWVTRRKIRERGLGKSCLCESWRWQATCEGGAVWGLSNYSLWGRFCCQERETIREKGRSIPSGSILRVVCRQFSFFERKLKWDILHSIRNIFSTQGMALSFSIWINRGYRDIPVSCSRDIPVLWLLALK